ncbi:hypothetical protein UFOVP1119_117 [uncultured Caudovirales phage]|uniref:Uncharacterized protein n=1 Tax=uncultured Caudovirales phage TaxID=2100421 RepID=A0A6J5RCC4_9CAUD|nr:hypothetical protein UFOVP1119_117 [uncultured Caudovirales phage]CAB4193522.1 hypothetical protein UFOVP1238_91 [uncultured Caudovirales phage]
MISLFKKKQTNNTYTPIVPSGLIAHTEKGYFYVKGKKRFKFISDKAMNSWNLPVIDTKELMMSEYPISGVVGFRDGSLLKDISDGKIYLVSDNKRRHVVEPDVLEWINTPVIQAGQKEIFVHAEGDKLDGN